MGQTAPDIERIKRNIQRMIDQNAPPDDIADYVAGEGVTPEQLRGESAPITAGGIAKATASGAGEGAISLATMPQDLGTFLGQKATGLIDRALGYSPEEIASRRQAASTATTPLQAPSSSELQSAVEQVTGPFHKPQNVAEEFAYTIGSFAPAAAIGPGGLVRKAAMAVIPGAASEGAGQIARKVAPTAEPYARMLAALTAAVPTSAIGAGKEGTKAITSKIKDTAAKQQEVVAETNRLYGKLRAAGIKYDANTVDRSIADVSKLRIDRVLHPESARLAELMKKHAGKSMDFEDLDYLKQIAGDVTRGAAKSRDKHFAREIMKQLDDIGNGPLITSGSIPAGQVAPLVKQAKELARRNILARDVTDMKDSLIGYTSGDESALRNKFGSYLRNKRTRGPLTAVEKQAFAKVVRREGLQNLAHMAGSRFGLPATTAGGATLGGGVGFMLGGPPGAAIGSALGTGVTATSNLAFRKIMDVKTMKAVDDALKVVLAGRGAQSIAAARNAKGTMDALLRALLTAQAARGQPAIGGP